MKLDSGNLYYHYMNVKNKYTSPGPLIKALKTSPDITPEDIRDLKEQLIFDMKHEGYFAGRKGLRKLLESLG